MSLQEIVPRYNTTFGVLLRWPLKLIPKSKVMRVRTGAVRGMKWVVGSGIHSCWLGTYESDKQQALQRALKPGMTVYDIGANTGFYSLLFARAVQRGGKVFAFEPLSANVSDLVEHLHLNRLRNVAVIQAAVGDKTGLVGFTTHQNRYQNAIAAAESATLLVPQVSLDELLDNHSIAPPDVLKIDVEGAEFYALQGAQALIARHKPIIFLALHGLQPQQQCLAFLQERGYEFRDLAGQKLPAATGDEPLETDEIVAWPSTRTA